MEKKKGFLAEFKEFISRGSVLDMAIGVIIATAFGKITTSLVGDVLMPLLGWLIGGMDLSRLNITLRPEVLDAAGNIVTPGVVIGIGILLSTIIDFVLVAFVVFLLVKAFNKAKENADKKKAAEASAAEEPAAEEQPPQPSEEILLLREIRDSLKK
ncbi:MAG TPA: large conductance mechanosensitive channel protein MscL [Oscillospiraceae bacterium]|nr:large conductance mechanosensitive channel protein MscL [Oscillospiraceae bacterium]HNW04284.1 large conductance mechanosensitive channel protein MscL [Oscillospiraceae bacterium]